jgi:hypothetical protein
MSKTTGTFANIVTTYTHPGTNSANTITGANVTTGGAGTILTNLTSAINNVHISNPTYNPRISVGLYDHIISFKDENYKNIVTLERNGTVVWGNGINVDAAAKAFATAIQAGVEMSANITTATKLRMRDSVFEDLIEIAKDKGSLTAEDLTYLLQASKIVEKLKGPKE